MPRSAGAAVGAALLLASCGGEQPPEVSSQLTRPRPRPAKVGSSSVASSPVASPPLADPAPSPGLTPLPSPNQVLASVASGRVDPFAPLSAAGSAVGNPGARPAPLSLPPGLVFHGVIRSGGPPEALVQFGGESGTLRVGQRGGRSTPLLPAGWSVAGIDVQQGRLTLRQGTQSVTAGL